MALWRCWVLANMALLLAALAQLGLQQWRYPMETKCEMTYMHPSFIPVPLAEPRYGLYLYREHGQSRQPSGAPALFIPGSAGTYKQGRSIASETARIHQRHPMPEAHKELDWYLMDVRDEVSAFDGTVLEAQAAFALRCLRLLHTNYTRGGRPPRILLVGHSMGGLVARAALARAEPGLRRSVPLLLTLATPHRRPPLATHPSLARFYARLQQPEPANEADGAYEGDGTDEAYEAYQGDEGDGAYEAYEGDECDYGDQRCCSTPTVSISGGFYDPQVAPALAALLSPLLPYSCETAAHFSFNMLHLPGVWASSNHVKINSCNQLVVKLAAFIDQITQDLAQRQKQERAWDSIGEPVESAAAKVVKQAVRKHLQSRLSRALALPPPAPRRDCCGYDGLPTKSQTCTGNNLAWYLQYLKPKDIRVARLSLGPAQLAGGSGPNAKLGRLYRWPLDALREQHRAQGALQHPLQPALSLVVAALKPCSGFKLWLQLAGPSRTSSHADADDGSAIPHPTQLVELTHRAAPLPVLTAAGRRTVLQTGLSDEVMAGLDYLQNASWGLRLTDVDLDRASHVLLWLALAQHAPAARLAVEVLAPAAQPTTPLALGWRNLLWPERLESGAARLVQQLSLAPALPCYVDTHALALVVRQNGNSRSGSGGDSSGSTCWHPAIVAIDHRGVEHVFGNASRINLLPCQSNCSLALLADPLCGYELALEPDPLRYTMDVVLLHASGLWNLMQAVPLLVLARASRENRLTTAWSDGLVGSAVCSSPAVILLLGIWGLAKAFAFKVQEYLPHWDELQLYGQLMPTLTSMVPMASLAACAVVLASWLLQALAAGASLLARIAGRARALLPFLPRELLAGAVGAAVLAALLLHPAVALCAALLLALAVSLDGAQGPQRQQAPSLELQAWLLYHSFTLLMLLPAWYTWISLPPEHRHWAAHQDALCYLPACLHLLLLAAGSGVVARAQRAQGRAPNRIQNVLDNGARFVGAALHMAAAALQIPELAHHAQSMQSSHACWRYIFGDALGNSV